MQKIISDIKSHLLSAHNDIFHFVTKKDEKIDYNISYKTDSNGVVKQNREQLSNELNTSPDCLIFPDQCHTGNVEIITKTESDLGNTDALITDRKNVFLIVLAADCVPVLLFDPKMKIVAAVHAGWKGTYREICINTILKMRGSFTCNPEDIVAYIGPSICSGCYEVGKDVFSLFYNKGYGKFIGNENNKKSGAHLDLWQINKQQLLIAGLKKNNIETSEICTYETPKLFSARRDGFNTGRFAVGICLC